MFLFNSRGLLLFFLLMQGFGALAQIKCSVKQYSANEGLSANTVLCSIKDREGFMWFGTWVGLCRFDGYYFKTYKSFPGDNSSLQNNRINDLLEDDQGFIWVKADDDRVYRFDKREEKFIALTELASAEGLPQARIIEFKTFNKREIWLRTNLGAYLITLKKGGKVEVSGYSKRAAQLPSNNVKFIQNSDSSTICIGTDRGLTILEKRRGVFTRFQKDQEAGNFDFTSVSKGRTSVCFGTAEGYLVILTEKKSIRKYKISDQKINNVCSSRLHDSLYFATTLGRKIVKLSLQGGTVDQQISTAPDNIYAIFEDSKGLLFIQPEFNGIYTYNPAINSLRYYSLKNNNVPAQLRVRGTFQITEDIYGNVWVKNGAGLGYYNRTQDRIFLTYDDFQSIQQLSSSSILWNDKDGILWLTAKAGKIQKLVLSKSHFKQSFINSPRVSEHENTIRGIMEDSRGRLWLGRRDGNLYIQENGKVIKDILRGEQPQRVYTILEDRKGNVWIGTKGFGLFLAVPSDKARSSYSIKKYVRDLRDKNSISSDTIYSLLEDKKGRIWAGSFGRGLILVNQQKSAISFRTVDNYFARYPGTKNLRVRHLAEDKNGNIWIGTTEGLLVYNPNSKHPEKAAFAVYRKKPNNIKSLGDNDVQFIYRDKSNSIWVLTSGGGLNKAVTQNPLKNIEFKNYSTSHGFRSDYLLSCMEDQRGNLWLGTPNNLARFQISTGHIRNYDFNDGLPDVDFSEASCIKTKSGEIIFGTYRGYISFHDNFPEEKDMAGAVVLTGLEVNNENFIPGTGENRRVNINYLDTLNLTYSQNNLSFNYAILNYRYEDKVQFQFRLLGYDDDWMNNKALKRATYTKLDPGTYTFEVRGFDLDYYKNLPAKRLVIVIHPPYWKTWWANAIYFALAVLILFGIKRIATTMLRLRRDIAIERQMTELKLNFFTQASHEIRTPLSLVISPLEEVLKKESLSPKGSEYINLVLKNARRMLRFFNQLLDLRKVQNGMAELNLEKVELVDFLRKEAEFFVEAALQRNISIKILSQFSEIYVEMDKEKMDIVVYNIISNAIKFSPENSSISLVVEKTKEEDRVCIKIRDQGPGVEEGQLQSIFRLYYEGSKSASGQVKGTGIGLALAKELVELHKGEIKAENALPGLSVQIVMPLNH